MLSLYFPAGFPLQVSFRNNKVRESQDAVPLIYNDFRGTVACEKSFNFTSEIIESKNLKMYTNIQLQIDAALYANQQNTGTVVKF